MNDMDHVLHDAGARQRATAPSATETEAALHSLGDVPLDDRAGHRNRRWMIGPAVALAAAAAVVGVVVLTSPEQSAVVPADTTVVAQSTTVPVVTTLVPTTVPAVVDRTTASTSVPATTTIEPSGVTLANGVRLQTSNVGFDGDGGACLTLSSATERAQGCATGAQMRTAFGQPLYARLDGTAYALFPTGVGGAGGPELFVGDTAVSACYRTALLLPGVLVDDAGCDSQGTGILGVLPATPDHAVTWTVVSGDDTVDGRQLGQIAVVESLGTRVFRSPGAGEETPSCTIVAAPDNSVRELCGIEGTITYLAGSFDAPLVVSTDAAAGGATIEPLDPATTLDLNECPELTAGELVGLLPEHGVAGNLLCRGDVGTVWVAPTIVDPRFFETAWDVLQRDDDGTWSVAASEVDYTCSGGDPGIAGEICTLLDVVDLAQTSPFPSAGSMAGFVRAVGDATPLPGRAGIEEVPSVDRAADLPTLAEAVAAAIRASMGGDGTVEVLSTSAPIVIRRSNLDDSITHTILVLNAGPISPAGEAVVFANGTRAIDLCGRGATTVDGETACV